MQLARPLGAAVKDLVTILKPDTLMRWIRATHAKRKPKRSTRKPGRPRTPDDIRRIVLRIDRHRLHFRLKDSTNPVTVLWVGETL